jgi:hypothetical protein
MREKANSTVRFIAFGDSTTNGPAKLSYPVILAAKMGVNPDVIINEGHGGEDTREGFLRMQHLLENRVYPNASALLYWQGGKDVMNFIQLHDPLLVFSPADPKYPHREAWKRELDEIQKRIEKNIRLARDNGLSVYIATYYPLQPNMTCKPVMMRILSTAQAANANIYVANLNDRIRLAARNQNTVIVDVELQLKKYNSPTNIYFDSLHFNDHGNVIVADLFLKAIYSATSVERTSSSQGATLPPVRRVLRKDVSLRGQSRFLSLSEADHTHDD